jgi:hypothetical protein
MFHDIIGACRKIRVDLLIGQYPWDSSDFQIFSTIGRTQKIFLVNRPAVNDRFAGAICDKALKPGRNGLPGLVRASIPQKGGDNEPARRSRRKPIDYGKLN